MVAVKCVLCKKSFNKRDDLKKHFVDAHSVPADDDILNRYVDLRFSSSSSSFKTKDWIRKQKILVRLLKLLKARVIQYSMNKNKIKVKKTLVERILDNFASSDELESNNSLDSVESFKIATKHVLVDWFLTYYDVYINETVDGNEASNLVSFYSEQERQNSTIHRLKIEQKVDKDLDFTVYANLPTRDSNPYESFTIIQYELYKYFFNRIKHVENAFNLMIEMTVEFVKSVTSVDEEEEEITNWENEGNFYSEDSSEECNEQRSVKEYFTLASGSVFRSASVYNRAMSALSQKVINSYNVTGNNWSLRRIISCNLSILANIDYVLSSPRLIKGRLLADNYEQYHPQPQQFDADRFTNMFRVCYDSVQASRTVRERMKKMMKGTCAATSRTANTLDSDDTREIKTFAKQYGHFMTLPVTTTLTTPKVSKQPLILTAFTITRIMLFLIEKGFVKTARHIRFCHTDSIMFEPNLDLFFDDIPKDQIEYCHFVKKNLSKINNISNMMIIEINKAISDAFGKQDAITVGSDGILTPTLYCEQLKYIFCESSKVYKDVLTLKDLTIKGFMCTSRTCTSVVRDIIIHKVIVAVMNGIKMVI